MSFESSSTQSFTFSSDNGRALCAQILSGTKSPYAPHDYQLEGVCKALDRVDVLAINPTGSGKSGFLVIYLLVYMAISQNPDLFLELSTSRARFQVQNPAMIVICPTKALAGFTASSASLTMCRIANWAANEVNAGRACLISV